MNKKIDYTLMALFMAAGMAIMMRGDIMMGMMIAMMPLMMKMGVWVICAGIELLAKPPTEVAMDAHCSLCPKTFRSHERTGFCPACYEELWQASFSDR